MKNLVDVLNESFIIETTEKEDDELYKLAQQVGKIINRQNSESKKESACRSFFDCLEDEIYDVSKNKGLKEYVDNWVLMNN